MPTADTYHPQSAAAQALACLHPTPNGGLAVITGMGHRFDAIRCSEWLGQEDEEGRGYDEYRYDGDGEVLRLGLYFDSEEFFVI